MNDKISILIADDNIEYCNLLIEDFSRFEGICVMGFARDGIETVEMILRLEPDVVVLDIFMPNLDGIGVLESTSIMQMKNKPSFIVLSAIGQDIFIYKAIALGAEYYVVKPFNTDVLVERIKQVYKDKCIARDLDIRDKSKIAPEKTDKSSSTSKIEIEVTNLLHNAGIPPHICGYQYLREAILMSVDASSVFNSVTKIIYPDIAVKYNTTPRKVERSIRCAIEYACNKGRISFNDERSEILINFGRGKPTNSQFISTIADKARIGMSIKHNKKEV
jgi:two-component system, response regulator, stage 0 sporulation protein A